jgi:DNA replication protein DnaC
MAAEGLAVLLRSFRLPTMAAMWEESVVRAERENWGYKRLLQHLCESEEQDRHERKIQRLLRESGLPEGKTLGNLDETILPAKIRRILPTLLEGHFVERAENLLVFGLPGRGKTHLLAALGRELILRHRHPVLFTPTFKLVQQLLSAKKEFRLESELKRLDRYAAIVLDDIGYVQQDRQEMEVLFTFLAERYERRSVLISSNLVFSKWDQIFKDPMTTMAAIDRLVHHATILEFNGESVRDRQARGRQKDQTDAPAGPFGSTPSSAPGGAKDSVPPKGPAPKKTTAGG